MSLARLRNRSATRDRRARGFSSSGNQYARRSLALRKPCAFDEADVGPRVVGHHEDRRRVEPVDEQARLVVQGRVGRSPHHGHLALAPPDRGRFEEHPGDLRVVFGLEVAEERRLLLVELVVVAVEDRGDPADVLSVAAGDEKLHLTVSEERVLVAEDLGEVVAQRRDPVRIGGVEAVGDVEEAGQARPCRGRSARRRPLRSRSDRPPDARFRRGPRAAGRPRGRPSRTPRGRGRGARACGWP